MDEPLKKDSIRYIDQMPQLQDLSPDDVIIVQDVSETTPGSNPYRKETLQHVVDRMNPLQSVNLTQAEYDALPESEKLNGTYYNITDSESTVQDELTALRAEINSIVNPTWHTATLQSGISAPSSTLQGTSLQYAKIGNRVYLKGGISFAIGTSWVAPDITILPTGFRPKVTHYVLCCLGGYRVARMLIGTNGKVHCDWIYDIGTSTQVVNTTVEWLDLSSLSFSLT